MESLVVSTKCVLNINNPEMRKIRDHGNGFFAFPGYLQQRMMTHLNFRFADEVLRVASILRMKERFSNEPCQQR